MGLDIYVGSLTRYYRRDWETIVQQAGRESGMEVKIIYARESDPDPDLSEDETRAAILDWRAGLTKQLATHLPDGLYWSEESNTPYFTDKPDWSGYGALVLWAAFAEQPQLIRPIEAIKEWEESPALKASQAKGFSSKFPSLIKGVELWLPGQFNFIFTASDASGGETLMGSTGRLQAELIKLNQMTWRASDDDIREWRLAIDPNTSSFDELARFGYSIFSSLVEEAVKHKLPMKMDY